MTDFQSIADRFEIDALRGEFTDAATMRDFDRFTALFTEDGTWQIPDAGLEFTGRADIRAGVERAQGFWEVFIQNTHAGSIRVDGDTASGRTYVSELGRLRDGSSHQNYALYHDEYRRTPEGWKFTSRIYQVRYIDTSPLLGTAPPAR
ncbi:nuclear transport factor 2 family protein [Amycolatopsis sp.]|uniref:nuclear transport factor 2 family protein n=1 Tax=Amycolatopsis sp. TaxID=37632 RepID=UPI002BAB0154|nr:nuclear transport factor 2 family protein [Amycolatopsis sp.]HVV09846.1 nuclear transport factor 2 family protein [Amycolatopsis sp.]